MFSLYASIFSSRIEGRQIDIVSYHIECCNKYQICGQGTPAAASWVLSPMTNPVMMEEAETKNENPKCAPKDWFYFNVQLRMTGTQMT